MSGENPDLYRELCDNYPQPLKGDEYDQEQGMRLAAVADIHLTAENHDRDVHQFLPVNDLADALVVAGDFTNHGMPEEMQAVLGVLEHIRIPVIAVLGNHDHESGHQDELAGILRIAGVHLLDGHCLDLDGIGFAGTKGFCGGFAPYELMPFGEQGIKTFVEIALSAKQSSSIMAWRKLTLRRRSALPITRRSRRLSLASPNLSFRSSAAHASSALLKPTDPCSLFMATRTKAPSRPKPNPVYASAMWLSPSCADAAKNTHSHFSTCKRSSLMWNAGQVGRKAVRLRAEL